MHDISILAFSRLHLIMDIRYVTTLLFLRISGHAHTNSPLTWAISNITCLDELKRKWLACILHLLVISAAAYHSVLQLQVHGQTAFAIITKAKRKQQNLVLHQQLGAVCPCLLRLNSCVNTITITMIQLWTLFTFLV